MGRDFPPVQTGSGAHPAPCTMGTASFPGVKCGRGVMLTAHPLLVPRSWKSRAIPLPTLWATTGPVTEHFTFLTRHGLGYVHMRAEKKLCKDVFRRLRNCMKLWKCLEATMCAERLFVLALAKDDCSVGPWHKCYPKH